MAGATAALRSQNTTKTKAKTKTQTQTGNQANNKANHLHRRRAMPRCADPQPLEIATTGTTTRTITTAKTKGAYGQTGAAQPRPQLLFLRQRRIDNANTRRGIAKGKTTKREIRETKN